MDRDKLIEAMAKAHQNAQPEQGFGQWDMTERKAGNSRLVYNKVTRTIDTVRTTDIDVCQADAGAKGETVSREGALQSGLNADAFYLDQSAWEGLRPAVRWRLGAAVAKLIRTGTLNRQDIEEFGEVSTPQASADIAEIMKRLPHLMIYDKSRKCYALAANSQSQIEEAQRADTMPLTSGETPDTENQDADNGK